MHVAVGLQSLKELLRGSVDDDLLTQLEPDEAAYALAASSGNDGFVRLDTLEDLVLEESSKYVGAKRILECEASVTALTYAPLSGLLASASADGAAEAAAPMEEAAAGGAGPPPGPGRRGGARGGARYLHPDPDPRKPKSPVEGTVIASPAGRGKSHCLPLRAR